MADFPNIPINVTAKEIEDVAKVGVAPNDGNTYGQKNGEWVEIEGGSSQDGMRFIVGADLVVTREEYSNVEYMRMALLNAVVDHTPDGRPPIKGDTVKVGVMDDDAIVFKIVLQQYDGTNWFVFSVIMDDLSDKQDVLTEENAGEGISITNENGIVKISATGGGADNWELLDTITFEQDNYGLKAYALPAGTYRKILCVYNSSTAHAGATGITAYVRSGNDYIMSQNISYTLGANTYFETFFDLSGNMGSTKFSIKSSNGCTSMETHTMLPSSYTTTHVSFNFPIKANATMQIYGVRG